MTLKEFIIAARNIEAISEFTNITFENSDGCRYRDDIDFNFIVNLGNALDKFNDKTLNRVIKYARPYSNQGYSCFSIAFKEN